jgi:hypothetical protein
MHQSIIEPIPIRDQSYFDARMEQTLQQGRQPWIQQRVPLAANNATRFHPQAIHPPPFQKMGQRAGQPFGQIRQMGIPNLFGPMMAMGASILAFASDIQIHHHRWIILLVHNALHPLGVTQYLLGIERMERAALNVYPNNFRHHMAPFDLGGLLC